MPNPPREVNPVWGDFPRDGRVRSSPTPTSTPSSPAIRGRCSPNSGPPGDPTAFHSHRRCERWRNFWRDRRRWSRSTATGALRFPDASGFGGSRSCICCTRGNRWTSSPVPSRQRRWSPGSGAARKLPELLVEAILEELHCGTLTLTPPLAELGAVPYDNEKRGGDDDEGSTADSGEPAGGSLPVQGSSNDFARAP